MARLPAEDDDGLNLARAWPNVRGGRGVIAEGGWCASLAFG